MVLIVVNELYMVEEYSDEVTIKVYWQIAFWLLWAFQYLVLVAEIDYYKDMTSEGSQFVISINFEGH